MAEEILQGLTKQSLEYIIDQIMEHRPKPADQGIPANTFLQLNPALSPLKPPVMIPFSPLNPPSIIPYSPIIPSQNGGFDNQNNDVRKARPGIYNDFLKYGEPHPFSRPLSNAAIPSSSQGFYKPFYY